MPDWTIISSEYFYDTGDLNSMSESATIPSDCTTIVALHSGYPAGAGTEEMDYFTIDGSDATNIIGIVSNSNMSSAMAVLHDPSTGAQTVTFTRTGTSLTQNAVRLVYLKGLDRTELSGWATAAAQGSGATAHDPGGLSSTSGRLLLAVTGSWNGSYTSVDYTQIALNNRATADETDQASQYTEGTGGSLDLGADYDTSSDFAAVCVEFTPEEVGYDHDADVHKHIEKERGRRFDHLDEQRFPQFK